MPKLETTNFLLTLSYPEKYKVTMKPKTIEQIPVSLNPMMKAEGSKIHCHLTLRLSFIHLLDQEAEEYKKETWKQRR